tara:strand:+ start:581 stop:1423 length:843 start_codon:yes stop_codon:yes gene_type:complete
MKIAIAVNTFDTDLNRFKLANQSYERLNMRADVDVFDIQKSSVKGKFKTIDKLTRVCSDVVPGSTKSLPFVNDLFNITADLDYDYFIVTNADVMISPRLIQHIIEKDITALPCSRLDVLPVNNISDNMKPVRWEVAGFDTFCFKTDWYKKHSVLFEDFLLGKPAYDQHYAAIMKVFGNNDSFGNKTPAFCLHEHHGISAVTTKDVEQKYNLKQYNNSELAQTYKHIWDNYLNEVLLERKPWMSFLNEVNNEEVIEEEWYQKEIFKLQDKIKEHKIKYKII